MSDRLRWRSARQLAPRLALALFGVIAILVLLESGLRLLLGRQVDFDRAYWEFHPLLGHVHPEGLEIEIPFEEHPQGHFRLVTNNHGLREDSDTSYDNPAGLLRILVLGDSHTDGTVFNAETYPNVLEYMLVTQGIQAEVLNAGVASYSPQTELLWFHFYGRRYRPDVVLLGVYVGNDLMQLNLFDTIAIEDDGTVLVDGVPLQARQRKLGEWAADLLTRSYLYTVARGGWERLVPTTEVSIPEQAFRICRGCYWQSLNQAYRFHIGEVSLAEATGRLENTLVEFQRQAEATGTRLVILLIPTKLQVEDSEADSTRVSEAGSVLGLSAEQLNFDSLVLAEMSAICEKNGMEVLNLLPGLQAAFAERHKPLYYSSDWHLNPAGHQAVAQILQRSLATVWQ